MLPLGYFILGRLIFESAIWRDDPHVLKLFIYLVGNARHSKAPKKYPGFMVKRGELLTSLHDIAEENEYIYRGKKQIWSRSKVSRMLNVLESQDYIKLLTDTYGTHISIYNYEHYQNPKMYLANSSDALPNSSETPAKQVCNGSENNSKNVKKVKKEKKKTYGEFKRVKLTDAWYEKLLKDFGRFQALGMIRLLDQYREENGIDPKESGNDNLTLRRWVLDRWKENKANLKNQGSPEVNAITIELNKMLPGPRFLYIRKKVDEGGERREEWLKRLNKFLNSMTEDEREPYLKRLREGA